jgi:hypothetical protein
MSVESITNIIPKIESKLDSNSITKINEISSINLDNKISNKNNVTSGNKEKLRCGHCNTRVNITNSLNCKCGQILCMQHRLFNMHNCSIDYKKLDKEILEKNNPRIVAEKIIKI